MKAVGARRSLPSGSSEVRIDLPLSFPPIREVDPITPERTWRSRSAAERRGGARPRERRRPAWTRRAGGGWKAGRWW